MVRVAEQTKAVVQARSEARGSGAGQERQSRGEQQCGQDRLRGQ